LSIDNPMNILRSFVRHKTNGEKALAVLIDPDKTNPAEAATIGELAMQARVDYFFVGSSHLLNNNLDSCIAALKSSSPIPVILFPGNNLQVSSRADAILFLSLISGRNADFLIGQHVLAAPMLKSSGLEIIPTGYMLIDCGHPTSVTYMSNTMPIPNDKDDIAIATALAGEMLGMKMIYMDAGSGARMPVTTLMIEAVRNQISAPLIVGGGIRTPEKALQNCLAGADIIVIGNSVEKDRSLMSEISGAVNAFQTR
jgi:phosphoglycerol geranylgeranyltransferase